MVIGTAHIDDGLGCLLNRVLHRYPTGSGTPRSLRASCRSLLERSARTLSCSQLSLLVVAAKGM
jgi:hypothetical protein